MPKVIKESGIEHFVEHTLEYEYVDERGSGFSFPCDEHGKLLPDKPMAARNNYARCIAGEAYGKKVEFKGMRTHRWAYRHPRIIECPSCKAEVELSHHFTNTCYKCGSDFDGNGNLLAPREQWGEETGEHWSEIYNIPPADRCMEEPDIDDALEECHGCGRTFQADQLIERQTAKGTQYWCDACLRKETF